MPAEQIANIIGRKQACRAGIQHRHVSAKIKDFCWCVYPRLYISKMCRVAVLQKTGNTSWEVLKYRYAAPGWVWGRARTRTREKANAFPLIRAYAEIPLRGMLHHNICFGHYFNTLTDFCTWPQISCPTPFLRSNWRFENNLPLDGSRCGEWGDKGMPEE